MKKARAGDAGALEDAAWRAGLDLGMTQDGKDLVWRYRGEPVLSWRAGRWESLLRPRGGDGDPWEAYTQACVEYVRAIEAGRIKKAADVRRWSNPS